MSGWTKRAAWFFTGAFFLVAAGFSLYLGLMGQSSCGCFGRIHVRPWNAFALDVACLALLGLCRPSLRREKEQVAVYSLRLRKALLIIGGVAAILTICLVALGVTGGSRPGDFLARIRGDRISVEPPVADMGSDVVGKMRPFTVRLCNHTDHPVRIVGGTASCACIVTDDLPVSIPPGNSVPVTVRAGFKGTPGLFQQKFFFYTDEKEQDRVLARFEGRVLSHQTDKGKAALRE